ncbi:MAG: hypothetical protein OXG37_04315 [Actinomycetia bacterium]|nr:hypothetical protein [Actinomycetes bacterium]
MNPTHELRLGELLTSSLPGVPVTLSHELNPSWREYRRASSAAIDASLKPLTGRYLGNLTSRMAEAGSTEYAIVTDTGWTTYDVSLVRGESIPWTQETWVGGAYQGHMTGFPSVDVRSIGAGGGSIAWVDAGGVLHVGPQSAGADPGPACYARGGTSATVTDASLVLGHLDPGYFLGGALKLDTERASAALRADVAEPLGLEIDEAAWAVIDVATESMVQAILAITVNQGIDPSCATLVGGGGAAGLNSAFVARRLGCPRVVIPDTGAALSAAGALMSHLTAEYRAVQFTTTADFGADCVATTVGALEARCRTFLEDAGLAADDGEVSFGVEAR